jgi:hypothetical protein
MRIYLSGPISYDEGAAGPRFAAAAAQLSQIPGVRIFDPYTYCADRGITGWRECMAAVVPELFGCDVVAVIDYETPSKGRDIELMIARSLGMQIRTVTQWVEGEN